MRLSSILMILLLSAALFAADVDFTGTWKFNEEKSELPEFGGPGGPGGGGPRPGAFVAPLMVVTKAENGLTVERTMTGRDGEERKMTSVYDLTGKTTKEEGRRGGVTEHTAKMEDAALKVNSVRVMERDGQEFKMVTNATWTLVDEGKGLLIESVSETPMGERKMKTYYDKQ
ncbi:hypothetical protein EH222_13485 [candidate division KSB1 bacterium]|nr:MAG: hypothetical protein EH222_13485 [candidate division KSB1 bacterium]